MVNEQPVQILLVEDNPGDVLLTKKAFKNSTFLNQVIVVSDGEAALQWFAVAKRPPPEPT